MINIPPALSAARPGLFLSATLPTPDRGDETSTAAAKSFTPTTRPADVGQPALPEDAMNENLPRSSRASILAAGEPAKSWDLPIRCTVFQVTENILGDPVTLLFDDDGSLFLSLPGHNLAHELVGAVALAVVRSEDRAQEAIVDHSAAGDAVSRAEVLRRARVDATMHDALQRWRDGQVSWEQALNFLAMRQSEEYTRLREQSVRAPAGLITDEESRLDRDLDADGETKGEES